jgi:hypothetical protein
MFLKPILLNYHLIQLKGSCDAIQTQEINTTTDLDHIFSLYSSSLECTDQTIDEHHQWVVMDITQAD